MILSQTALLFHAFFLDSNAIIAKLTFMVDHLIVLKLVLLILWNLSMLHKSYFYFGTMKQLVFGTLIKHSV